MPIPLVCATLERLDPDPVPHHELACFDHVPHEVHAKVVREVFRRRGVEYHEVGLLTRFKSSDAVGAAKGGSGVWGVMVMPPSPKVSEADRRILAKFVLSSK